MRWTCLYCLILSVAMLTELAAGREDASAQTPRLSEAYTIYHVIASDPKRAGKDAIIHKNLKSFAANLKRYDYKKFELAGLKEVKLTSKAVAVALPQGFGSVTLTAAGKNSVKVRLIAPKAKPLAATLPSKKPIEHSTDHFKKKSGQQYIFLLVKKKQKKSS